MIRNDPKPASHGPQVTTSQRMENYNVLAAFPDMGQASRAIEALGLAGIEGQHVTLQGEAPEEATREETLADTADADRRLMGRWFGLAAAWGVAGAALGLVAGIPVGIGAIELADENVTLAGVIASALFGTLFGGIIGWLIGIMYYGQGGDAWELGYHKGHTGRAIVGVHAADPKVIDKAREVLQKHGAINVTTATGRIGPRRRRHDTAARLTFTTRQRSIDWSRNEASLSLGGRRPPRGGHRLRWRRWKRFDRNP